MEDIKMNLDEVITEEVETEEALKIEEPEEIKETKGKGKGKKTKKAEKAEKVEEPEEAKETKEAEPLTGSKIDSDKEAINQQEKVTITVPKGSKNEENFIIISVNGYAYKIKKGTPVEVPKCVAEVYYHSLEAQDAADEYIEGLEKV